jgi:hypothetical protein
MHRTWGKEEGGRGQGVDVVTACGTGRVGEQWGGSTRADQCSQISNASRTIKFRAQERELWPF